MDAGLLKDIPKRSRARLGCVAAALPRLSSTAVRTKHFHTKTNFKLGVLDIR